jgi:hypothetical protein
VCLFGKAGDIASPAAVTARIGPLPLLLDASHAQIAIRRLLAGDTVAAIAVVFHTKWHRGEGRDGEVDPIV